MGESHLDIHHQGYLGERIRLLIWGYNRLGGKANEGIYINISKDFYKFKGGHLNDSIKNKC